MLSSLFASTIHNKKSFLLIFSTSLWHLRETYWLTMEFNLIYFIFKLRFDGKTRYLHIALPKKMTFMKQIEGIQSENRSKRMLEKKIKWRYQTCWQLCSHFKKRSRISMKNISWDSSFFSGAVLQVIIMMIMSLIAFMVTLIEQSQFI